MGVVAVLDEQAGGPKRRDRVGVDPDVLPEANHQLVDDMIVRHTVSAVLGVVDDIEKHQLGERPLGPDDLLRAEIQVHVDERDIVVVEVAEPPFHDLYPYGEQYLSDALAPPRG